MVTGMGLAGVLRQHYSKWLLYPLIGALVIANTINAGADLGAIGAAFNLLIPALSVRLLIVPIGLTVLLIEIWGSYRTIARALKWLTFSLFAYIATPFFAHPNLHAVLLGTVVPSLTLDRKFLAMIVAILGTTISPYLFFWQANQEVEEETAQGRVTVADREGATTTEMEDATTDVGIGMLFSNIVMYFIILATGATLFQSGKVTIESAADAALALRPLAGNLASLLFTLGIVGTGLLAVPILTASSAYAVAELFGWPAGLDRKPKKARAFYAVIALETVVAILMNYIGINPMKALVWTAVMNGFVAPPLLVVILITARDERIMGRWATGRWLNALGWFTVVTMTLAAVGLLFS